MKHLFSDILNILRSFRKPKTAAAQSQDPAELLETIEKLNQEINKLTGEVAHYKLANERTATASLELVNKERRKVELLVTWIKTTYRVDSVPDIQDLLKLKI